jgi:hypothetical protein
MDRLLAQLTRERGATLFELIRSPEPSDRFDLISNALTGFTVVDRYDQPVGIVTSVHMDRTSLLFESRPALFRRKQQRAVHLGAIKLIDIDRFTIVLTMTKDDVAQAPAFQSIHTPAPAAAGSNERSARSDELPLANLPVPVDDSRTWGRHLVRRSSSRQRLDTELPEHSRLADALWLFAVFLASLIGTCHLLPRLLA